MLRINGLKVATFIGIHTWEHQIKQTLLFDLTIPIDVKRCQDNIANTLDYDSVSRWITEYVSQRSFRLLETAADQIVTMLQQQFSITHLTLSVTKMYAVKNAGAVQITLQR